MSGIWLPRVQGLAPIVRGIIKLDEKTQERELLCEGHALLEVMNTPGQPPTPGHIHPPSLSRY
jgi:hypothetical protein